MADLNAFASLKDLLDRYGLGSLTNWAWDQLVTGKTDVEISLSLADQPAFKQRFPAIDQMRAKGLPVISPAEYIAYETQARQLFRAAGFPPDFFDSPDDFTTYIANGKSLAELSQQAALYQKAAYDVPAETRQWFKDTYGVDEGHLAAYFATPEADVPKLVAKFETAQIGGQAQRQQFGQLSQAEAERLRALGVNDQTAASGFATIKQADELFHQLPGEANTAPGRQEALGLVSGDAGAQQAVDLAARRRKAPFSGGGGYATTQQGATGLGSAAR